MLSPHLGAPNSICRFRTGHLQHTEVADFFASHHTHPRLQRGRGPWVDWGLLAIGPTASDASCILTAELDLQQDIVS